MNTNQENPIEGIVEESTNSKVNEIGEMSLNEGIKSLLHSLTNIKFKHIGLGVLGCFGLCGLAVLMYFVVSWIINIVWDMLYTCVSMAIGTHTALYDYCLFDSDLLYTIPMSFAISLLVGCSFNKCKLLFSLLYTALLVFNLELWDYWFSMYSGAQDYMGAICLVLMYVCIPILFACIKRTNDSSEIEIDDKETCNDN